MKLNDLISDFDNLRDNFNNYTRTQSLTKTSLNEYQHRFMDIKSKLRPWKKEVQGEWMKRDDKAATAYKGRLAISLSRGEIEGYDKMSLNQANNYASSTPHYEKFVEERAFYKESLVNLQDMRDDCQGYINLCKDYLKDVY